MNYKNILFLMLLMPIHSKANISASEALHIVGVGCQAVYSWCVGSDILKLRDTRKTIDYNRSKLFFSKRIKENKLSFSCAVVSGIDAALRVASYTNPDIQKNPYVQRLLSIFPFVQLFAGAKSIAELRIEDVLLGAFLLADGSVRLHETYMISKQSSEETLREPEKLS